MADALDQANQSLYGPPPQQETLNPWRQMFPFSMDPGSSYGQGGSAQGSAVAPPLQAQQQPPASPYAPQSAGVPQQFAGPEGGGDAGQESKQFANSLGQGVLAASQAAGKQGGGMNKKKLGQQGGADSSGASGGGWGEMGGGSGGWGL